MKWYAGSDHAGLRLKRLLIDKLHELADEVVDLGTYDEEKVDYPEFAAKVGLQVVADPGTRGLLVCSTGMGMAIAANKIPGVRAAVVHDSLTAEMARQHLDANVIAVGARVIGPGVAEDAIQKFRGMPFLEGRHQRRVDLIMALEKKR